MSNPTYATVMARLDSAQKSSRGASPYSRLVNRPLGRRLASVAFLCGLTPDIVTVVSACFTFTGISLLALVPERWPVAIASTLALVLGYALDSADGQLARLRGGGSVAGEWLDHMVDCLKISAFHLAVLIGLYRFAELDVRWMLLPLAFSVAANVTFFGKIFNDQLRRNQARPSGSPPEFSRLQLALAAPRDYGLLVVSVILWAVPPVFVVAYLAQFAFSAAFLIAALPRWYAEMQRIVTTHD